MSDDSRIVVAGKRVTYTEIPDSEATVERIVRYLFNGTTTAKMAGIVDSTPIVIKPIKDIIVKTAFKR
tara:strand:+ start:2300 stop:2503 length:204 start_codon:yes stop_codon:yes gene_type:complete